MKHTRRPFARVAVIAAIALFSVRGPSAQDLRATDLLDRYYRGEFDAVVTSLEKIPDFDDLLTQLKDDGPAWIDAAGRAARDRREVVAATVALEAARIGEWTEWKHREKYPDLSKDPPIDPRMHDLERKTSPPPLVFRDGNGQFIPEILFWETPPLLIEWGCELLRRDGAPPDPAELKWQLAALAVAQRSEDFEFLFSEGVKKLYNPKVEIDHLLHASARFPHEPRFMLAEGIATEWRLPDRAIKIFDRLQQDPDVGAEARIRTGAIYFRQRNDDRAISALEDAEARTRDPWLVYLARYFKGQALERRKRPAEAERAYRGALAAVPASQSASVALASLLFRSDRRTEASDLITTMLARRPAVADPWRGYVHADDRFWPTLIARLRLEIRR